MSLAHSKHTAMLSLRHRCDMLNRHFPPCYALRHWLDFCAIWRSLNQVIRRIESSRGGSVWFRRAETQREKIVKHAISIIPATQITDRLATR